MYLLLKMGISIAMLVHQRVYTDWLKIKKGDPEFMAYERIPR